MKEKKTVMIEYGDTQIVRENYRTIEQFKKSGYMEKYASNFGYNHLIQKYYDQMEKYEMKNIYITEADPKHNFGLDFRMWKLYTADQGILFFKQIKLGGACISNTPLRRVHLTKLMPEGLDLNDSESVKENPELVKQYFKNCDDNICESFSFSTNVGYKKDQKYRDELRKLSKEHNFIFA